MICLLQKKKWFSHFAGEENSLRTMKKSENEEFEYWQGKYIEMFGEENLFTTIFMSHDEILGIFKKAVKENKPYKEDFPKGAII